MIAIPFVPPLAKTIFVPSGDHDGSVSVVAFVVTRRSFVPSALITQISPALIKASFVPSGDQAGYDAEGCVIVDALIVARTAT